MNAKQKIKRIVGIEYGAGLEYDNKVEVIVRLKKPLSPVDYKTVRSAAESIVTTVAPYLIVEEK